MASLAQILKKLGPGIITGASDDDPSGIGTYAQAGAAFGFGMLWTALFSLPMMITVQAICARIGMVTGRGLSGVLRHHYPRWVLWPTVLVLFVANTINVGADLGAVAYGIQTISGWPSLWVLPAIAVLIVGFQIMGRYRMIARASMWLTLTLFAYIITAFMIKVDWLAVAKATVIPHITFNNATLAMLVAIWGTTISPYLFFWQASMVVEEEIQEGRTTVAERRGATDEELSGSDIDVTIGMTLSNVVMFFIVMTTGATLYPAGTRDIQTAQQAAEALRPLAGSFASWLFSAGLISTGLLAVPVLAGSSAYALAEGLNWKHGLDQPYRKAKGFYWILAAGILIGMGLNYLGINPIKALFWTAVLNGLVAPPLLILIMLMSNNREIMGEHVNRPRANILGWIVTGIMTVLAVAMLLTLGK